MEKMENKKQQNYIVNRQYNSKEVERLRKIVDYVTIESNSQNGNADFNDWGNHSEYTRGW